MVNGTPFEEGDGVLNWVLMRPVPDNKVALKVRDEGIANLARAAQIVELGWEKGQ